MKRVSVKIYTWILLLFFCGSQAFAHYPWCEFPCREYDNWDNYSWLRGREDLKKQHKAEIEKLTVYRPINLVIRVYGPKNLEPRNLNVEKIDYLNGVLSNAASDKLYLFLEDFFDNCLMKSLSEGFISSDIQWNAVARVNGAFADEKLIADKESYKKPIPESWLIECFERSLFADFGACSGRSIAISNFIFESFYCMDRKSLITFFIMLFTYYFNSRTGNIPELFEDVYRSLLILRGIVYKEEMGLGYISMSECYLLDHLGHLVTICNPDCAVFRSGVSLDDYMSSLKKG